MFTDATSKGVAFRIRQSKDTMIREIVIRNDKIRDCLKEINIMKAQNKADEEVMKELEFIIKIVEQEL